MISLNLLWSQYYSTNIQIILSAKSLLLFSLTFWLYTLGSTQGLPSEKCNHFRYVPIQFARLAIFQILKVEIYDKIFHSENFINLVISILYNLPHMDIITNIKKTRSLPPPLACCAQTNYLHAYTQNSFLQPIHRSLTTDDILHSIVFNLSLFLV